MQSHELYLLVCLHCLPVQQDDAALFCTQTHVRPWLQLRQEHFDPCPERKYRVAEQGSTATLVHSRRHYVGGTGVGDELLHTFCCTRGAMHADEWKVVFYFCSEKRKRTSRVSKRYRVIMMMTMMTMMTMTTVHVLSLALRHVALGAPGCWSRIARALE